MAEKKGSIIKTLVNLMLVAGNIVGFFRNLTTLAELEARLAGRSIMMIIVLLIVLASLITATWLSVLAMLFLYLISINLNPILSMLIITVLNILALVILCVVLSNQKKNLLFPNTRRRLRALVKFEKD